VGLAIEAAISQAQHGVVDLSNQGAADGPLGGPVSGQIGTENGMTRAFDEYGTLGLRVGSMPGANAGVTEGGCIARVVGDIDVAAIDGNDAPSGIERFGMPLGVNQRQASQAMEFF
jgi:hypothetical protein